MANKFKAKMDCVYFDGVGENCEVKFNNGKIIVSYEAEGGPVLYEGEDKGNGHFFLKCPKLKGRATLHQTPGSQFLEGYWIEGGARGFWRISLLD